MKKTFMKLTSALFVACLALISADVQAGCNDPAACNYNAADTDALDCVFEGFTLTVGGGSFDTEVGWVLTTLAGDTIDEGIAPVGAPYTATYCLPDTCYNFEMSDTFGDGWNGATAVFESYDGLTTYYTANGPADGVFGTIEVSVGTSGCTQAGCTDPGACNYDAANNQDDGSCEYLTCAGCTDPAFCEFDPLATISDFAQCLTTIGCFDTLSCQYDPSAACGDQVALCAQSANDTCGGAIDLGDLSGLGSVSFNANNANTCVDEFTGETGGLVWTFTTPAGPTIFDFQCLDDGSGDWDNQIAIFDTCGGTQLFFDDQGGDVGNFFGLTLDCDVLAPSTTYYIMIDGFLGAEGSCDVQITVDETTCITGCTNPLALNYDSGAIIPCDNGGGPNDCCIVPDCTDPAVNVTYCYDNGLSNETIIFLEENDPGQAVIAQFIEGTIESSTFEILEIYDGTPLSPGALLYTNAGLGTVELGIGGEEVLVESVAGSGGMFFVLSSDASVSCQSSTTFIPWSIDVYCGSEAVPGCTNPAALNYDVTASFDDGSCVVPTCTDTPVNYTYCYDNNADGSIIFGFEPLTGTDQVIISFNAGTIESSTFELLEITSQPSGDVLYSNAGLGTIELDGLIVQGNPGENVEMTLISDASVSCQTTTTWIPWDFDVYCGTQIIYGCTDPAACNYNMDADVNDGSCCLENCVVINLGGGLNDFDIFWFLEQSDGTNVFGPGVANFVPYNDLVCLTDDCYTLRLLSSVGAGWVNGVIDITDFDGNPIYNSDFASGDGDGGYLSVHFFAVGGVDCATCQDPNACNYDPAGIYADCDACEYSSCAGCTYSFASNYDPAATYDNGSCLPPAVCPGDADGNNAVNVLDLVAVSSNFGSTCP